LNQGQAAGFHEKHRESACMAPHRLKIEGLLHGTAAPLEA
jgi:hypothetical protein